jgi:hypothetical protein
MQICQLNENPGVAVELAANHPGITPIMLAAVDNDLAAARVLLQRGASVGLVNCYGRTALIFASMHGHIPMARLLLSVGAVVDVKDAWGLDAPAWAEKRGFSGLAPIFEQARQKQRDRQKQLLRTASPVRSPLSPGPSASSSPPPGVFDSARGLGRGGEVGIAGDLDARGLASAEAFSLEDPDEARAVEEAMREAREAISRAARAKEAAREAALARKAAADAASAVARANVHRQQQQHRSGGWGFGIFSARGGGGGGSDSRGSTGALMKPSPDYEIGPRAARVRNARKAAAASSRGRMLSTETPRSSEDLLRNRPSKGYLSPKRHASPPLKRVDPFAITPSRDARVVPGGGAGAGAGGSSRGGAVRGWSSASRSSLLSRYETQLLEPPPGSPPREARADDARQELEQRRRGGGGGWGWLSGRGGGGKQSPADESGGRMDEHERRAIERRLAAGEGGDAHPAAGAITDPSRFADWSARSGGSGGVPVSGRSSVRGSARSFWDSPYAATVGTLVGGVSYDERMNMLRSQRRREWINSSRRFIEKVRNRPGRTQAERQASQQRLYSARRNASPRVYC